ncbi:MAG: peptidoglycan DD-metalloendopeptidase family protein [Bacteroidia bacterium]|nr:peptidoglycan DD-metalloendopeptidase family protein [Bacteroidia bacterium]
MTGWNLSKRWGLLLVLVIWGVSGLSQSPEGADPERLREQISLTEQMLQQADQASRRSLSSLNLLQTRLRLRQSLVQAMQAEIQRIAVETVEISEVICSLEEDIVRIQAQYALTVRMAYQALPEEDMWLLILSADNLTEAWSRAQYLRQFSRYRARQVRLIHDTRAYLARKQAELAQASREAAALLSGSGDEIARLEQDKSAAATAYQSLASQAETYRAELEAQKKALKKTLKDAAPAMVASAAAGGSELTTAFNQRKGRLPWPVSRQSAVVTGTFGKGSDAFGNTVTRDGIFLQTAPAQAVTVIHGGKVSGVQRIPLSGTLVIVSHGTYHTVYANLEEVQVSAGQSVSAGQLIGRVRTDPRTQETVLNFLIYQAPETFLDPQQWLEP